MSTARLRVRFAGPLVSFQDAGRGGNMRFGVPASGPMDRFSAAMANVAIGNAAGDTAIEVSAGGIVLDCVSGAVTLAIAGGAFDVVCHGGRHDGVTTSPWSVLTMRAGESTTIRAGAWGSWAYVAVAGDLDVDRWLGHTATHSMAGLGGGMLSAGHEILVTDAREMPERDGEIDLADLARPTGVARVVMGPQDQHFEASGVAAFCTTPYVLSDAYDRMGVRLRGAPLPLRDVLSIPSEPILRGSVQVAGDGVPTVLLADHQTTGGYPKIATVISADLDRFTQMRAGDTVRFEAVSHREAIVFAARGRGDRRPPRRGRPTRPHAHPPLARHEPDRRRDLRRSPRRPRSR